MNSNDPEKRNGLGEANAEAVIYTNNYIMATTQLLTSTVKSVVNDLKVRPSFPLFVVYFLLNEMHILCILIIILYCMYVAECSSPTVGSVDFFKTYGSIAEGYGIFDLFQGNLYVLEGCNTKQH